MTKSENVEATLEQLPETRDRLLKEIRKGIIGQDDVIEQLLVTLLAKGHCLLTGIPGLGKTLLVKTLSKCLSLGFKRIQFTPDLMPADVVGTEVVDEDPSTGKRSFRFSAGPIFTNIVLADEINRTPAQDTGCTVGSDGRKTGYSVGRNPFIGCSFSRSCHPKSN
jgi:MoxR-like ATPase